MTGRMDELLTRLRKRDQRLATKVAAAADSTAPDVPVQTRGTSAGIPQS